jgi:hypothetical protein
MISIDNERDNERDPTPSDAYLAPDEFALRTQYLARQLKVRLAAIIEERRAAERHQTYAPRQDEPGSKVRNALPGDHP